MLEQLKLTATDLWAVLADTKVVVSPRHRWQLGVTVYLVSAFLAGNLIGEIWHTFGGSIA